jgi:hypothetical protein
MGVEETSNIKHQENTKLQTATAEFSCFHRRGHYRLIALFGIGGSNIGSLWMLVFFGV